MRWWRGLINIIFPTWCCRCGRIGDFLCSRCHGELEFVLAEDLRPVLQAKLGDDEVVALDGLRATFNYNQLLATMIHQYKYAKITGLAPLFGYWLYQFAPLPTQINLITYIPIHARRRRERGFNQAELLARQLAARLDLPCRPLLERPVYREKQARSRSAAERLVKARDIFRALPAQAAEQVNQQILIIDDVVTTGATINQAAKVLKLAGWPVVYGLALAHGS